VSTPEGPISTAQTEAPTSEATDGSQRAAQPLTDDRVQDGTTAALSSGAVFGRITREIDPEEILNIGAIKMVLAILDKADRECATLRPYVDLYHDADKRAAVLSDRNESNKVVTAVTMIGTTLGGGLIGVAPSASDHPIFVGILVVIGVGLIGASGYVVAKRK
jgi:hypothetical protein